MRETLLANAVRVQWMLEFNTRQPKDCLFLPVSGVLEYRENNKGKPIVVLKGYADSDFEAQFFAGRDNKRGREVNAE